MGRIKRGRGSGWWRDLTGTAWGKRKRVKGGGDEMKKSRGEGREGGGDMG